MRRLSVSSALLPLIALLLTAPACVVPDAKAQSPEALDYFPLIEDASWSYMGTFNAKKFPVTRLATKIVIDSMEAWVFLEAEERERTPSTITIFTGMFGLGAYRKGEEGLETWDGYWLREVLAQRASDRQLMLALPPTVGASLTPRTESVDRSGGFAVEAIEPVKVPAGTFKGCARIGLGGASKAWLCPDIGLVKWILVTGRVNELTSWSIPGGTSGP